MDEVCENDPKMDHLTALYSGHFKDDCHATTELEFYFGYQKNLKPDAVPTIKTFLPEQLPHLPDHFMEIAYETSIAMELEAQSEHVETLDLLSSTAVVLPYAGNIEKSPEEENFHLQHSSTPKRKPDKIRRKMAFQKRERSKHRIINKVVSLVDPAATQKEEMSMNTEISQKRYKSDTSKISKILNFLILAVLDLERIVGELQLCVRPRNRSASENDTDKNSDVDCENSTIGNAFNIIRIKMKGKGKGKEILERECPLQFPDFSLVDKTRICPRITSVLARTEEEGVALEDLDVIQLELETLLTSVNKRKHLVQEEMQILISHEKKDKKFTTGKGQPELPVKRGKSNDDRPSKKFKDSLAIKPTHLTPVATPRPAKNKNMHINNDNDVTDSKDPRKQPENDVPIRFWNSVEPYCADVTEEHIKFLEELITQHEDDADYHKIPALGKHYSLKWAQEDLLEEQKEDPKVLLDLNLTFKLDLNIFLTCVSESVDSNGDGEYDVNAGCEIGKIMWLPYKQQTWQFKLPK
ncbi:Transcriptional adapter 3-A [Nymphon striatum]|nr:Transcriptional adapter 3-A [Nymphon striatum]